MSFVRACFVHLRVAVIKSLVFFKDEWEYQDIVQSFYRGKECFYSGNSTVPTLFQ
jgi:hypothetical protein